MQIGNPMKRSRHNSSDDLRPACKRADFTSLVRGKSAVRTQATKQPYSFPSSDEFVRAGDEVFLDLDRREIKGEKEEDEENGQ
jgi:hypothetical protein